MNFFLEIQKWIILKHLRASEARRQNNQSELLACWNLFQSNFLSFFWFRNYIASPLSAKFWSSRHFPTFQKFSCSYPSVLFIPFSVFPYFLPRYQSGQINWNRMLQSSATSFGVFNTHTVHVKNFPMNVCSLWRWR